MLPSASSRSQLGSGRASDISSVPSSHNTQGSNHLHPSQVSTYLRETDPYRAFLCQGHQRPLPGLTASHDGSSHRPQGLPENSQHHDRTLALAQYERLEDGQMASQYGASYPYHGPTQYDGWNNGEVSPQCDLLGYPYDRPTRYGGHNSDQVSTQYGVPGGGPAQSQNSVHYGKVYPPQMIVTSRNGPRPMMEDAILDEHRGPPPYEVAVKSQAMMHYVRDWAANWDQMERDRSGEIGDAGGR